ncbi:MAG: SDR family NAD(P)-dependent oxidoreductase, partial [Burkholderiales bacterium]|nr:SDR family NAD(P)-dependent oxidoreductase [Burkholderiales bacterium]
INNAGVIAPLRDLARIDAADTLQALRVGLEAPALLCAAFIAATADWRVPRRVLNISSGLGRRAMAGSASYCAAKAGLDHLSRCLALEEAARPNGARVVSLAPGVIATDMQVQLRGADPAEFADRSAFVAMHDSGQLLSPEAAAARVLAFLDRADFGEQPVADVRG